MKAKQFMEHIVSKNK